MSPFDEVAALSGLDARYLNGAQGSFYISEIMGAGVGLLDYDDDGDLDAYLLQGGDPGGAPGASDRLFRNELEGAGVPRFVDVTEEASISAAGYGMGVATGDFDNDGRVDLYVANFGANRLLHNDGPDETGRVTFSDVTAAAGADDPRWSVAATFFDLDGDGWLDLYIANYLDFRLSRHVDCSSPTGRHDYCGPQTYRPQQDRLLRNLGDGTFEDVSESSGIAARPANSLGVVALDADGDGRMDLYVANDGLPNLLWLNRSSAAEGVRFEEQAALSGLAVNGEGRAEASMGMAVGDADGDGSDEIFLTHLGGETNTLYRPLGGGQYADRTLASGLGPPSLDFTSFGTRFFDLENDGDLDLLTVGGAIKLIEELAAAGDPFPFHEPSQLFLNQGDGRFVEAPQDGVLGLSEVSRGAAFGDVDNDGDVDVLVSNNGGPARLFLNRRGDGSSWLGVRLLEHERDALGARAALELGDGRVLWRRVATDGSYASASDPRLLFGLGDGSVGIVALEVHWPDGGRERFTELEAGSYRTVIRGSGESVLEERVE